MRASTGRPAFFSSRQNAAAWRATKAWPITWTRIVASHSAASELTNMRSRTMPALFTTTSSPPKVSTALRTSAAAPSQELMSS